jgi:hypothetical protein
MFSVKMDGSAGHGFE